jgi:hypothetical protein
MIASPYFLREVEGDLIYVTRPRERESKNFELPYGLLRSPNITAM